MNIKNIVWCVSLSIMLSILMGCQVRGVKSINGEPSTAEYFHYSPSEVFEYMNIKLDYPSSWLLEEVTIYPGVDLVTIVDPETAEAMIAISAYPIEVGQTPDTKAELFAQRSSRTITVKLLGKYEVNLKDRSGFVVETQFGPIDNFSEVMYGKTLFFSIGDNMYEINLTLVNEDRGGDFEKGYEYLLNSIEIIP
jgi:hypothetical protein